MNEDVFNASIRKFLKTLGVSAQREIEKAVREALATGKLKGHEKLPAKATVTLRRNQFHARSDGRDRTGVSEQCRVCVTAPSPLAGEGSRIGSTTNG